MFCCIFILLSQEIDRCATRARLGVASHLSTTLRGNPARSGSRKFWWGGWNAVECELNTIQRRLDPETGVNKPFENVSCQGRVQIFFQEGASHFVTFLSVFFSGKFTFKQLK